MKRYYIDTSVLLVYTLARDVEVKRYKVVRQLFELIRLDKIKATTSFYALHELYLFALEHAPTFDMGAAYGKEALNLIFNTKIQVTPLLTRMERKINERFFRNLPDATDLPHAISSKIWNCDGIIAYDEHFASITDVIEYCRPDDLIFK